jgi:hypothetical protein
LIIEELDIHRLGSFFSRGFDGRTHNNIAAWIARDSALDHQQTTLCVNTDNIKVLHSAGVITKVTRHTFAWKNTAWVLSLANRTRNPMRTAVTVRSALRFEVVAFDRAGETFTNCGTGYVDLLTRFENAFDSDDATGRKFSCTGGVKAEFFEDTSGFYTSFGIVTGLWLGYSGGAARTISNLNGGVTV